MKKEKIVRVAIVRTDEVKNLYRGYGKKVHHGQILSL